MRRKMVAGNWKMFGRRASAQALAGDIAAGVTPELSCDVLICPSFVHLEAVRQALGAEPRVLLGGQDLCAQVEDGARTGEISGAMLADVGASHVLVGHSERRQLLGESNESVGAKFQSALEAGLTPVLCVGETLAEREGMRTEAVIATQLQAVADAVGAGALERGIIAYEPVWAIGTGRNATPQQAQGVHAFVRDWVATQTDRATAERQRILYGGSVKPDNAAALFAMPDVDGGLVGGASLKAADFLAICRSAGGISCSGS